MFKIINRVFIIAATTFLSFTLCGCSDDSEDDFKSEFELMRDGQTKFDTFNGIDAKTMQDILCGNWFSVWGKIEFTRYPLYRFELMETYAPMSDNIGRISFPVMQINMDKNSTITINRNDSPKTVKQWTIDTNGTLCLSMDNGEEIKFALFKNYKNVIFAIIPYELAEGTWPPSMGSLIYRRK